MKKISKLISMSMLALFNFNNSFAMNPKSLIVDEIDGFDQFENDRQYSIEDKTKFVMNVAYNMVLNYNSEASCLNHGVPTPPNSNFYRYKNQVINKAIDSILNNFYSGESDNEQYNVIFAHAFTLYKIAKGLGLPTMIVLTGHFSETGFGDLLNDMTVFFKGKLPGDFSNIESEWISCGLTYSCDGKPTISFKYVNHIHQPEGFDHKSKNCSCFNPNNKDWYLGYNQFVLNLPDNYLNNDDVNVNRKVSDLKIINATNPENLDDIHSLSKIDLNSEEGEQLIKKGNVVTAPFEVEFFLGRCL